METTKRITVTVEKKYVDLLNSLPNKSKVVSNLIALLFNNVNESDLMKIAYASSNNETLQQELKNILYRNIERVISVQTEKVEKIKSNKAKELAGKKSISAESWESWW
jgi:restriction endonuclease